MNKSWVMYQGGYEKNTRKKGPGRIHVDGPRHPEALTLSPRKASPSAPDRPCSMRRRLKFKPKKVS